MDDRDIVAAIVAGDADGIAFAYDKHAASLYGYCYSQAAGPADAAVAVQDTFIIAAARLDALRDPRKLRPWLYAVARCQCRHQGRPVRPSPAEPPPPQPVPPEPAPADEHPDPAPDPTADAVAEDNVAAEDDADAVLARSALRGLPPAEREVIELSLGHHLVGSDLAAVLGVSRSQAHALVARARGRLERSLGAPLAVRGDPQACPALGTLLGGGDGRLTALVRKRIGRHLGHCEACAGRVQAELDDMVRSGLARPPAPPPSLREEVLRLCAEGAKDAGGAESAGDAETPEDSAYREWVIQHAGQFGPGGFPRRARPPRRVFAVAGAAAAAGILAAAASTGIASLLGSPQVPGSLDAAHTGPGSAMSSTGNVLATQSATTASSAAAASGAPADGVPIGPTPSGPLISATLPSISSTLPSISASPSRTSASSSPPGSARPTTSASSSSSPAPSASSSSAPPPGANWPPPSTPPATGIP